VTIPSTSCATRHGRPSRHLIGACALALWLPHPSAMAAADPYAACRAIADDFARLACYDLTAGRAAPSAAAAEPTATPVPAATTDAPLLTRRWQLDPATKTGTFQITTYKPVYALPFFHASSANQTPYSPNPIDNVTTPLGLEDGESKFQLSLKTKLWQQVLGQDADLWFAYTQASHWQVFNAANSRPFRETNYEPELIMAWRTRYSLWGWQGTLASLSLTHQSNGQSDPESRSWNRIIGSVGLERDDWVVVLRSWLRLKEGATTDNNHDITDYVGYGDLSLTREWRGNEFSATVRHHFGSASHGSIGLNWAFPLARHLSGYFQVFNGYGESLIDYNHSATYVGLGVSLVNSYTQESAPTR
jgi:phospholipase A1